MIKFNSKAALLPIVFVALLIVAFIVIEHYSILPLVSDPLNGKLNDVDSKTIEIFRELNTLFINWSVAIIGGIGFFLKSTIEENYKIGRRSLISAELVILSAVVSMFFGHMSLNALLNMLALDTYCIRDDALLIYGRLQYFFFLSSLLLFCLYVHFTFWGFKKSESGDEPKKPGEPK